MEKVIIFSAPSGAGKTTIVHHLLQTFEQLSFSVSATTRLKRENEINGVDYYFMEQAAFENKIQQNEFLEFEEVYKGTFYGTLKSEIDRIWHNHKIVVFDVDVIGGLNLKKYFKDKALAVFVSPPSLEVLKERLQKRQTESQETLEKRIGKAAFEMQFEEQFDVTLVNNNLNTTFAEAENLVRSFLSK